MRFRWPSLSIAVLMLACSDSTDAPADDPPDDPAGITNVPGTTTRSLSVGGSPRTFIVHVGASVGANTSAPVVFMLHGTSGDGQLFYDISGWRQKADAEGFIAVFPSSLTYCFFEDENKDGDFVDSDERKITTKWTHGDLGNPAKMPLCSAQEIASLNAQQRALVDHPLRDDIAFFDAMVSFLKANYRIDEKAIYAAGFSNGAQMTNRLAIERSQVFAATAAHAGAVSVPTTNGRALSAVVSVGTHDDRYTTLFGLTEFPCAESTLQTYVMLGSIFVADMLDQLNLTQAYTYDESTVNGKKFCRWTFSTSEVGASNSLQFVMLQDNYHTYPNGSGYPVVMANVTWPFFASQRLP